MGYGTEPSRRRSAGYPIQVVSGEGFVVVELAGFVLGGRPEFPLVGLFQNVRVLSAVQLGLGGFVITAELARSSRTTWNAVGHWRVQSAPFWFRPATVR